MDGNSWVPVRNAQGHFSVWPARRQLPDGWRPVGAPAAREAALDDAAGAWREAGKVTADPGGPAGETVDSRFFRLAHADPARVAVIDGVAEYTYGQLAARAARVCAGLARIGVGRGGVVGIRVDNGADLIAVLMGVLARGAAYLPLDAGLPPARLAYMLRDAGADCVVQGSRHTSTPAGVEVRRVDTAALFERPAEGPSPATAPATAGPDGRSEPDDGLGEPDRLSEPDALAYIMFTSGSTGEPKSVEVTHRNLLDFLDAMAQWLPPGAARRTLLSTGLSFDIAGLEIFLPLVTGGACLVAPHVWLPRSRSLARLVNTALPTLVQATPVRWRMLLEAGARFGPGQTLLCGGDALPPSLAERLADFPARAFNMYGPTEATVWATAGPIDGPRVSIGTALPHARVHVLDDGLLPVGDGAEGEAYIAGPAVARGYRGRLRLTAERFVPDPWSPVPGGRMYATGDTVRAVEGRLEWLRRGDTQVKLNGNRIELGEIESVAVGVEGVRAAVAVITGDALAAVLVLFVEGRRADGDADALARSVRALLSDLLPPAMIPRRIEVLDALPVTANGKVDRTALAARAGQL